MQDMNIATTSGGMSGAYRQPMPETRSALLEEIDAAIEYLQSDLNGLHDRLNPVLGPDSPLALTVDEPQLKSPLRSRLDRLQSLHHGFVQLSERIDL